MPHVVTSSQTRSHRTLASQIDRDVRSPAGVVSDRFKLCHETHRRHEAGTSLCVWTSSVQSHCLIRPVTRQEIG